MSELNLNRERVLSLIGTVWLIGILVIFGGPVYPAIRDKINELLRPPPPPVVITHWANGHMTSETLLPSFARQFNAAGYKTASGSPIVVQTFTVNSAVITCQLIQRIANGSCEENKGTGGEGGDELPNPTIVSPAADHWLSLVNRNVGQTVIDMNTMRPLATTYIGIATYADMAQCLGWPSKEIGFADIVALAKDPSGWEGEPCAKIGWGAQPLISFTDPGSSSTGRTMLYTLYSIAAGVPLEQLTQEHIADPAVVEYVKGFQKTVDHYFPDTLILNTKIYLGPRYGHFFFIAEDNLVKLYQGKIKVTEGGKTEAKRLSQDMVMIYPKEGSPVHNHSAGIVRAEWVTPEQLEAADKWVNFLYEEAQQKAFMEEGFRPGNPGIPYVKPTNSKYWPDLSKPTIKLNPDRIDPATAEAIAQSWGDVKKPGVVTFIVDTSGSMSGKKLERAKEGLERVIDSMNKRNSVGLLAFSDSVNVRVEVAPITLNRFEIAGAIGKLRATGETALYSAIKEGILMTDNAPGESDAIRGVVVLTDGQANRGLYLSDLIQMQSRPNEISIITCQGFGSDQCEGAGGQRFAVKDIIGTELAMQTRNRIHIFYVGIGDADYEVCRIMTEATASACKGATEEDLARVLEEFGKYF